MEFNDKLKSIINRTKNNGFNVVVGDIWLMQEYWKSWWRGDVNDFHHFKQKVNGRVKKFERRTLNTFKMVCEEWESLIWSENVALTVNNNPNANKRLQEVLDMNNDYIEMGNLIEKYFAIGNGATIVYKANNKTNIDYISGQQFIPLAYENNTMSGMLTISDSIDIENGKEIYITHLTYNWVEDDNYYIKHEVYTSNKSGQLGDYRLENIKYVFTEQEANEMLMTISDDKDSTQVHMVVIPTSIKFFQPYRPNISNNYDESTMGISIGANSIDLHESIDIKFDASSNEILNNKTRIVVKSEALKRKLVVDDEEGSMQYIQYLDENDTVIMAVPFDDESGETIKHFQGDFRMDQIEIGINQDVQLLGWRNGFGKKYFAFKEGDVYVNEANVISSNSALYKNKKKHENLLGRALIEKAKAIMYLENDMGNISVDLDSLEYEVTFDDSIITDDNTILQQYRLDAQDGLIPEYMYIMKAYKVDEATAKKWIVEASQEFNDDIVEPNDDDIQPPEEEDEE